MGFPTRANRTNFGPTFENERPVTNPKREFGAGSCNLLCWQVSGLSQTGMKAAISATVSGSTVTPVFYGLAFDPDSETSPITFTRVSTGVYSFAFNEQYPDEQSVNRNLGLSAGLVVPINGQGATGAHDGGDDQMILTDSTQSWTTNEFVWHTVYNLTDGSFGIITANTDTTVTATLLGGSENNWDNGDQYRIWSRAASGQVHLSSGFEGEIIMFDHAQQALMDPEAFLLLLW